MRLTLGAHAWDARAVILSPYGRKAILSEAGLRQGRFIRRVIADAQHPWPDGKCLSGSVRSGRDSSGKIVSLRNVDDRESEAKPIPLYDVATDRERVLFLILTLFAVLAVVQLFAHDSVTDVAFDVFVLVFVAVRTVSMTRLIFQRRAEAAK